MTKCQPFLPGSIGLINDKKGVVEFATSSSQWGKQGPAALINYRQGNVDQIPADKVIKRSGVRINRKNYKKNFFFQR
jgi:hypothetical protein